ncbi:EamA domain-containing membrane protein RarD [Rhodovulum bhavnagarense]|uniref:EamA domain-containing membrane protein RarD n=1 Tax=Rhodovulum bhavnagarense TaxID=992286 RepID=A0A4R2RKV2_9RHOB|nr:DMT family transporter [Rhodovulum bhavnagarense]TCP60341.1 EamA domain-containing membrane protein RarD [Rhodovulum bhavnagarense]
MNPARAIALKLAAVTLFVAMSALIKVSAAEVPPGQAVFFRSFFAIPVIVIWLAARGDLAAGLRTRDPLGHLGRGVIGVMAMGLMFTALGLLPLPEVTAIGYATPLLIVIFAALFLGERVRMFRLAAVGLGLVGVLIVLWPRLSALDGGETGRQEAIGALIMLGGATCAALAQVMVRKLVQRERTEAIVFWFSIIASVLSLLTMPFGWTWPSPAVAVMLVLAGLIGGVAQVCLTLSYRHAEAAVVAPFDYASLLLALVVGYAVFDEVPTPAMLAGAGLVIAAGILIIWRERQLGLERGRARQGTTPQG